MKIIIKKVNNNTIIYKETSWQSIISDCFTLVVGFALLYVGYRFFDSTLMPSLLLTAAFLCYLDSKIGVKIITKKELIDILNKNKDDE